MQDGVYSAETLVGLLLPHDIGGWLWAVAAVFLALKLFQESGRLAERSEQCVIALDRAATAERQLASARDDVAELTSPKRAIFGDFNRSAASYKVQIANFAWAQDVEVSPEDIHDAIDRVVIRGRFTPPQGAALKVHEGKLHGLVGLLTACEIALELTAAKAAITAGER